VALLFVGFAWYLAHVTPIVTQGSLINAPDEGAHIGYVRALAEGRRLPVRADAEFPTYQWHQPPLYYAVAALGHPLGSLGMRAVSILFALASLWAIWAAARLLAPRQPAVPALAVAAVALLPMRQAVHASVGNDAAIECWFSLTFLAMAHMAVRGFSPSRGVAVGVLVGVALLTKLSGLLLVPGVAVLLFALPGAQGIRRRVARAVWPLAISLAIASPWLALNVARYGQPLPLRAFHQEFAQTARATDWIGRQGLAADPITGDLRPAATMTRAGYSALIANWTCRTYLGAYTPRSRAAIGAPVFLPPGFYIVYVLLMLVGLVGLGRKLLRSRPNIHPFPIAAATTAALVFLSFASFTWTYFQAQGRYLYPAILPLAVLWALGLDDLIPLPRKRQAVAGVIALLTVLALAFAFAYVAPAYGGR
jgi:4-amino-4-deoxy-L-arabinose transferase-like glycosyltransferase